MGDALAAPLLGALLAIAPALPVAAPSASPSPAPLREIGRVRATTAFCKSVLEHAATGINTVLDNDAKFANTEYALRHTDLDSNMIVKFRNTRDLTARFVALRAAAVAGNGVLAQLKRETEQAPTDEQKAALLDFANALDGALYRQKQLADSLGKFVAYVDTHDPISPEEHDRMEFEAILSENTYTVASAGGPMALVPQTLTQGAKMMATSMEDRQQAIKADENDAAAKIDQAFQAC